MRKPPNLIYGVTDDPPVGTLLLLGLQHILGAAVGWVILVAVVGSFASRVEQTGDVLRMSMVAAGVGTILQGLNRGGVGSGYLCPFLSGPAYVSASTLAGNAGGFPVLFGMTTLAGVFEVIFSRLLPRLRALFPPEVIGLVVTMVGFEMVPLAAPRFLGLGEGVSRSRTMLVAFLTLAVMCACTIWGKGAVRLYAAMIGVAVGWLAAFALGNITPAQTQKIAEAPWVGFPRRVTLGWAFDWRLLVPFLVAALSSSLKGVGDLTLCQKINDADWVRPDMKSISRGITAAGLCTTLSGLLGTVGHSTSSNNVGLSLASGATSRRIGYSFGGWIIALAFLPKVAAVFTVIPRGVMGAMLVFAACFMILAGIQVLTSRLMDARRILVAGIALLFGLSVDVVPGLYKDVPHALQPIVGSALSLATVLALVLNLIARIGLAKKVTLQLDPKSDTPAKIFSLLETQGGAWGARKDVIYNAAVALNECFESVSQLGLARDKLQVGMSFDEFNLDIDIIYEGAPLEFPAMRPSPEELLADDRGLARLSGFLIAQHADRVRSEVKDGRCHLHFHFNH